MDNITILIQHLSATYGKGSKQVHALQEISLEIKTGEIFGLLGPNGAGKTTLLSCIEGLHHSYKGELWVGDLNVRRQSQKIKSMLGIQLQRTSLLDYLTVSELVEFYAALYEVFPTRTQIARLLEQFQLSDLRNRTSRKLSGGQVQHLALALAVANNPKIILLDEPTEALDPHARRNIWQMIRKLHEQGRTIILTTHAMEEAEALCGRVAIIDHGKVIACAPPARMIDNLGVSPVLKTSLNLPLERVQMLPGVLVSRYSGQYLEMETSNPQDTLLALQELAKKTGALLGDITLRQPNLEDVFLKLTGRQLNA